jgi:hypothetical protein
LINLGQRDEPPPDWYTAASYWYTDASDWYHGRVFQVTKAINPTVKPPWLCYLDGNACFDVTAPNGSLYFLISSDRYTEGAIASIAKNNPEKFNSPPCPTKSCKGGYGHDPILVDLTHDDWLVISMGRTAGLIFLGLAVGVPLALLVFGFGLRWVAIGFKPR